MTSSIILHRVLATAAVAVCIITFACAQPDTTASDTGVPEERTWENPLRMHASPESVAKMLSLRTRISARKPEAAGRHSATVSAREKSLHILNQIDAWLVAALLSSDAEQFEHVITNELDPRDITHAEDLLVETLEEQHPSHGQLELIQVAFYSTADPVYARRLCEVSLKADTAATKEDALALYHHLQTRFNDASLLPPCDAKTFPNAFGVKSLKNGAKVTAEDLHVDAQVVMYDPQTQKYLHFDEETLTYTGSDELSRASVFDKHAAETLLAEEVSLRNWEMRLVAVDHS